MLAARRVVQESHACASWRLLIDRQSRQETGRRKAGKEASCVLAHTWDCRFMMTRRLLKNRQTRTKQCRSRQGSPCFRARGPGAPGGVLCEAWPRGTSVGLGLARAGLYQTPADSCVGWKGPPAPGPCQPWRGQAEAGRRHPKKSILPAKRLAARLLTKQAQKGSADLSCTAENRCRATASLSQ